MKIIALAVFFFVALIITAQFFAPAEYQWTENTVSELAAQGLRNGWIMRAGFIGFGLLLNIGYLVKFASVGKTALSDLAIMIYGIAILITGIYSTAPFIRGVDFSIRESNLHSFFAQIAGASFTLAIILHVIRTPNPSERRNHLIFLFLVVGFSALFGLEENGLTQLDRGLVQRSLYSSSFAWLLYAENAIQLI